MFDSVLDYYYFHNTQYVRELLHAKDSKLAFLRQFAHMYQSDIFYQLKKRPSHCCDSPI